MSAVAEKVDKKLKEGAEEATAAGAARFVNKVAVRPDAYALDAQAIAKVLVKHYGDEAEAVLSRASEFCDGIRRTKR